MGNKHTFVSSSKSLFSSLNKPQLYVQPSRVSKVAKINDPVKPIDPVEPVEPVQPINPNLYENLNELLIQYGFTTELITASKTSIKHRGYWELLYLDPITNLWYDYASTNMSIQNIDSSNYIIEQPDYVAATIINDKRFEYYDESYVITDTIETTENFPPTKDFAFVNNPNLTSTLKLIATVDDIDVNPYVEKIVNRTSCFVFSSGTTCFLLIHYNPDANIKKIYCMQTWTNDVYTELDPVTNMCYLNSYLADSPNVSQSLPDYWTFTQCILDDESMIALFSVPNLGISARVISDGVGNSYQYVRPEEAPFLYNEMF